MVDQVLEDERLYRYYRDQAAPDLQPALAAEFGVVQSTISHIDNGQDGSYRLTEAQINEIRERLKRGRECLQMAKKYTRKKTAQRLGVSPDTVGVIRAKHSKRQTPVAVQKKSPVHIFLTRRANHACV
jgi:DNA-binding XRE family transcriptional regulator